MRRGVVVLVLLVLVSFAAAAETTDELYEDIGSTSLTQSAGLTPDSAFYFLEVFMEGFFSSDDPETVLAYKEEKIAEVKQMILEGKVDEAKIALGHARRYGEILKEEVSPDTERRTRESSKAVKDTLLELDAKTQNPELRRLLSAHADQEDEIAMAAKVSTKIQELCQELSALDPLEYERVCKTDDDAPRWQRQLDEKLTDEQQQEAEAFFGILSACFENPRMCRCTEISVPAFAQKCSQIAPLAAECEEGDDDACEEMEELGDPIELLPAHLQQAMEAVEDKFRDSQFDLHMPKECVAQGALTKESCMKVMFTIHAPEECQEALERGEIDVSNEHEARKRCEQIMFKAEAPEECIEKGIDDRRECDKLMFKLDAPEECIEAGLTGEGRNDWKKCEIIRFKSEMPKECLDAGLDGSGRNDWKECDRIRFKLDAPEYCLKSNVMDSRDPWKECEKLRFKEEASQECLDAGLTGQGRDDWKKCHAIEFKLDAPDYCLKAGLDGTGRDDWKKCDKLRMKEDMPEYCQKESVTGARDPWRECEKLKFKEEAPEECQKFAGERDPWRACDKIQDTFETHGERREECDGDELHICEDGSCKCVSKEEYDREQGFGDDDHDDRADENNECKDGCDDECPGADRTQCVEGNRCECYYEDHDEEDQSGHDDSTNNEDSSDGSGDDQTNEDSDDDSGSGDENDDDQSRDDTSEDETNEDHTDRDDDSSNNEPEQEPEDEPEKESEPEPVEDSSDGGNEITGEVVRDVSSSSMIEWFKKYLGFY